MLETLLPPFQRWLLFSGVMLVVGAVTWRGILVPRVRYRLTDGRLEHEAEHPEITRAEARVAGLAAWVSVILLLTWGLRLWAQYLDFRDPFTAAGEDLRLLLLDTDWGIIWIVQGGIIVLLLAGFLLLRRRAGSTPPPPPGMTPEGVPRTTPPLLELPLRWKAAATGAILLVLTLGLSSHAMSVPGSLTLAVSVDVMHTLAAGGWIGTLLLILTTARPRSEGGRGFLALQLAAFSPLAMVAVGALVFMGILLSVFHTNEIAALWNSEYGRRLSAKVGLAGGVMVLGLWNWRRGLPALVRAQGQGDGKAAARAAERVWRSAAFEITLAALVVLATAILVATPVPPGAH